MSLRPRHAYIARSLRAAFDVDPEVAEGAVKRALPLIDEVLSGSGSAHVFAFYTPTAAGGKPELSFSREGGNDSLKGKAVYFVRASADKPVDLDKVRRRAPSATAEADWYGVTQYSQPIARPCTPQVNDGALLFGEVGADVLGSLAASLGDVFQRHVAERTEWGKADASTQDELKSELARVAKSLSDTMTACHEGLVLSQPPPNLNLEDALHATVPRGKSKKATIDIAVVSQLQGEGAGAGGRDCARVDGSVDRRIV